MKKRIVSMLLAAAAVLALCTSALAASAGTARRWQVYVENGSIYCKGLDAAAPDTPAPVWQPAWLPEGWSLEFGAAIDGVWAQSTLEYFCGEETLSFGCCAPSSYSFCRWLDFAASAKTPKQELSIQGYPAEFWQVNQQSVLTWEDRQGNLFQLFHSGSLTRVELEKIANSVTELKEPMPEYRLSWTQELSRSTTMPGYVRDISEAPDFIRFTYAVQPLTAPGREPEAVTVQGIPAQLWLGDQTAEGTIVTSAVSGKTVELPNENTWSTLIWTDPETGICFRIQGNKLPKETMLRLAESVELDETAPQVAQTAAVSKAPGSNAAAPSSNDPNASRQSWIADGMKAVIVHEDGTVERVPNFSELFPGQELG